MYRPRRNADVRRLNTTAVHAVSRLRGRCVFKLLHEFRMAVFAPEEHADNQGRLFLPGGYLFHEKLLALGALSGSLMPFARSPSQMLAAPWRNEVVFDELILRSAVDFQHAERLGCPGRLSRCGECRADQNPGVRNRSRFEMIEIGPLVFSAIPPVKRAIRADTTTLIPGSWEPTPARTRGGFGRNVFRAPCKNSVRGLQRSGARISRS